MTDPEDALWAAFAAPNIASDLYATWLAILCAEISGVNGAIVLLGEGNTFAPAAIWPDSSHDMSYLVPTAQHALTQRAGVVGAADGLSEPVPGQAAHVAYPVVVAGALQGAVVLDLAPRPAKALRRALRQVHWAIAWVNDVCRQQAMEAQKHRTDRLALAMDVVGVALHEPRFRACALAVADAVAARLQCERVSLGLDRNGSIEVKAISNSADFDAKADFVRRIAEAMDEVLDFGAAVVLPSADPDALPAAAHAELARENKDHAICSVPLVAHGRNVGVMTLERKADQPFDAPTRDLVETIALLVGPVLQLEWDNERGFLARLRDSAMQSMRMVFGPGHPGVKLIASVAVVVLLVLSLLDGEYRVTAKTVTEGAVQRAVVAPFEGYVAQSLVRAGDRVSKGQVLCRLDDRDLKLEWNRWVSERDQASRKHRQALATLDRASMSVLAAQISQAQAQLSLVEDKLARATLTAPFDGLVASGDLSQLLGTPVEQGKTLFEITPLDAYRIILKVDERDIAPLKVGQQGVLALSGLPNESMPFTVNQITPVSVAEEGRNYFRVEARLDASSLRLRPGMEGVGKVTVGERRLIWIWTHSLVDWMRLWLWHWLP